MSKRQGPARRSGSNRPASKRGRLGAPARTQGKNSAKATKKPGAAKHESSGALRRSIHQEPLKIGLFIGASVGRWLDTWQERYPKQKIEIVWLAPNTAAAALEEQLVDIALVRLPLIIGAADAPKKLWSSGAGGFNIIPLYEELTVAISHRDSLLADAEELTIADLAGETLVQSHEDPVTFEIENLAPTNFDTLPSLADSIATVAAGVGFMLQPMSIARHFDRKDLRYRIVNDLPKTPVALVWLNDSESVNNFVGIVRGRSANSSRS